MARPCAVVGIGQTRYKRARDELLTIAEEVCSNGATEEELQRQLDGLRWHRESPAHQTGRLMYYAASELLARRIGEKDRDGAAHAAVQAILLGVFVAVPVGVVAVMFGRELLQFMGASPAVLANASFTRTMLGASGVILLLFLINAVFRGAGVEDSLGLGGRGQRGARLRPAAGVGAQPSAGRLSRGQPRGVPRRAGEPRQELLREYAEAGVDRVMGLLQESAESDEPLATLAEDARAAGMTLPD